MKDVPLTMDQIEEFISNIDDEFLEALLKDLDYLNQIEKAGSN